MRNIKRILAFPVLLIVFMTGTTLQSCKTREKADYVILNAKVVTTDSLSNIVEAVAVKGERILEVGTNRKIRKRTGKKTRVIDAEGRTVIPGLTEAHLHPLSAALSELTPGNSGCTYDKGVVVLDQQPGKAKSAGRVDHFPEILLYTFARYATADSCRA